MKKLLTFLLALTILLSLAACGGKNDNSNSPNQANSSHSAASDKDTTADVPAAEEEDQNTVEKEETDKDAADSEEEPQQPDEQPKEDEKEPEAVITASHSDVTFKAAGSSFQLTASPLPANVVSITYASEDETIATVAEDGTVTAVAPGTTTVTMTLTFTDGNAPAFTCIVRCSWQEAGSASGGVDLSTYFNNFMTSLGEGNTPAMAELNAELIDAYYAGLNEIERKQTVMQMAAMMQVAFEFALVECENASDVETVKSIFQARVDSQVNGGAFYPAVTEAWEKAEIITSGSIVALIVAGDAQQSAVDAFHAACGK